MLTPFERMTLEQLLHCGGRHPSQVMLLSMDD